ncbi:formamidopyrimidine-DNA glycosylase [Gloeomargarita lithophora Alchichica-D10]|uniref:Formamidopyrimidine-DNA glycosylase n=1 Tax=Gloeomargarita lithophora Alchichica-D10 TaxID=1188229 RepID=A0A1J0AGA4_9CYAN|nr:DNA-formamidopyrimidine glycosylase [Gloeomargarita lithophora]APB34977.1 formamidopyrimidine-DNA glycosylase [Gloeomargarita lithophora Alchichica-D10]
MPELPEVEIIRRGLVSLTPGLTIAEVELLRPDCVVGAAPEFTAGLCHQVLQDWQRRGKYLLGKLSNGGGWVVHLRMTGQLLWLTTPQPVTKHTRARIFFTGGQELRFVDQRTFGRLWWVAPGQALTQVVTGLQNLGLEPWDCSAEILYPKCQRTRRAIKSALLDQTWIAGLGNIYADECLFLSGIDPQTPCQDLSAPQVAQLHQAIVRVLETSIQAGGTTFAHFRHVQGMNGHYLDQAWVYGRAGQPCRVCGTAIQRQKIAGRSSHFCPRCQPKRLTRH